MIKTPNFMCFTAKEMPRGSEYFPHITVGVDLCNPHATPLFPSAVMAGVGPPAGDIRSIVIRLSLTAFEVLTKALAEIVIPINTQCTFPAEPRLQSWSIEAGILRGMMLGHLPEEHWVDRCVFQPMT